MHPAPSDHARRPARSHLTPALLAILATAVAACNAGAETPVARARLGDTLVRSGKQRVLLEKAFRAGVPNGLYGGVVRVLTPGSREQRLEVNGVCSMPGLQAEGWPAYDNLYGRSLPSGDRWQILFYFDGRVEASDTITNQEWQARLRDNLCRRGSFKDTEK